MESWFVREYGNFGERRKNFVYKMSSAVHTWAPISNPCLPISNYVTTYLKRFISRAGHFMKKNYHLGRREVAHRVEVKTRERWIQGYCALCINEEEYKLRSPIARCFCWKCLIVIPSTDCCPNAKQKII